MVNVVRNGKKMKILKIVANNFKNINEPIEIDFIPKAKKTEEDKAYELLEIDENLFIYANLVLVGKNASGKSSILEIISIAHNILSTFDVEITDFAFKNTSLEIYFYYDGYIYYYKTNINYNLLTNKVEFDNELILEKKYSKSISTKVYDLDIYKKKDMNMLLPNNVSKVFFLLKETRVFSFKLDFSKSQKQDFNSMFGYLIEKLKVNPSIIYSIMNLFDENITKFDKVDEDSFSLVYMEESLQFNGNQLQNFLSSGTLKGMYIYTFLVVSLLSGITVIIDEIENHFNKLLVENIINLFKDKTINKNNANLIFSTHYLEILDIFNRRDNIYITRNAKSVCVENLYDSFDVRSEILKSKQFYNNTFKTSINYEVLTEIKKAIKDYV